jgi:hypothetical protein
VAARRLIIQARHATWILCSWEYSQVQVSEEQLICSARGCRNPAVHALRWNNPKLHTPDRRKTWLACDAHLASLGDFLRARQFLREVEPLAAD